MSKRAAAMLGAAPLPLLGMGRLQCDQRRTELSGWVQDNGAGSGVLRKDSMDSTLFRSQQSQRVKRSNRRHDTTRSEWGCPKFCV